MGSHDTHTHIMAEDPLAWMKKTWSIRIQVVAGGNAKSNYTCYSTVAPFEASPEQAQQAIDDLRSKIMSICVSNASPSPLVGFERQAGGERLGRIEDYYMQTRALEPKHGARRVFFPVVDECIIPAHVLKTSLVRITLVEEFA